MACDPTRWCGMGGGGYISRDGMGNHTGTVTKGPTYLIDFKMKHNLKIL